jgi:hypothetical protein
LGARLFPFHMIELQIIRRHILSLSAVAADQCARDKATKRQPEPDIGYRMRFQGTPRDWADDVDLLAANLAGPALMALDAIAARLGVAMPKAWADDTEAGTHAPQVVAAGVQFDDGCSDAP